jgi:hypothetical protein
MNQSLIKQIEAILINRKAKLNVRLVLFVFFLFVATILWYLNKLSYEYTADVTFPLKIVNMPKGKVIVGEPPQSITLGVKAFGYTLLRYRIASSLSPISLNLNQIPLSPIANSETKFFMLTSRARSSIVGQLKGELQLEQIAPDSLFFEFTQLAEKRVEVRPNIKYSFEKQYMLSGPIKVLPDSIIISGPSTLIDTISFITTDVANLVKLTSTENLSLALNEINQVGFSHRRVNVNIPVEKFTEAHINQTIEIRNLPDTLRLILIPRSVDIKCNVAMSSYKDLRENLEVFVDYRDIHSIMDNRLPVQLISQPYVVKNLNFEPMFVEFIIEKL